MPIYETGHARNIQNFATMIAFVNGWGGDYKPTNVAIEPPETVIDPDYGLESDPSRSH